MTDNKNKKVGSLLKYSTTVVSKYEREVSKHDYTISTANSTINFQFHYNPSLLPIVKTKVFGQIIDVQPNFLSEYKRQVLKHDYTMIPSDQQQTGCFPWLMKCEVRGCGEQQPAGLETAECCSKLAASVSLTQHITGSLFCHVIDGVAGFNKLMIFFFTQLLARQQRFNLCVGVIQCVCVCVMLLVLDNSMWMVSRSLLIGAGYAFEMSFSFVFSFLLFSVFISFFLPLFLPSSLSLFLPLCFSECMHAHSCICVCECVCCACVSSSSLYSCRHQQLSNRNSPPSVSQQLQLAGLTSALCERQVTSVRFALGSMHAWQTAGQRQVQHHWQQ